ncbi:hypothetical protein CC1G_13997 [Coprinopsis cinerea okayama7|uniref:Uncharacterized protein n=1 Tax=Coprinopsis cinerea (strain Okayama-7 / 130 / ATCC MYA-4618 / FGSC 9003) TaxID=240176 RepID=D6RKS1_COPC7|nr:hypothetical protein CC1G_13997 [Coprinopsis cinerea okayama7\|eukprot:XP_002911958.1 hypothetical protein CC1G_13997 [Coprinopsis cinerea okayama7\
MSEDSRTSNVMNRSSSFDGFSTWPAVLRGGDRLADSQTIGFTRALDNVTPLAFVELGDESQILGGPVAVHREAEAAVTASTCWLDCIVLAPEFKKLLPYPILVSPRVVPPPPLNTQ